MIPQIKELNFPSYATLSQATVTIADMGDRTITTNVRIDGSVTPDFSYDWEVEFQGDRYIHPLRKPQASKGNDSIRSSVDLTFYHWAIYQMKREFFVELTSIESGTAIADKYIASLGLNLGDFVTAFAKVLEYYYGDTITVDLNPEWEYKQEPSFLSISYSYVWDVLQKVYETYGARWTIERLADGKYSIRIGYPAKEVTHIFEYGYKGGLLKFERQVQDTNIRNSLLGRGGEDNLPAYYFKEAPEGSEFASDPDAIPELANIYFDRLRGKTFRDYVRGWKAKHYGGEPMAEPTDAYNAGYTDEKFNPIEYVEDAESIAKYGILRGGLEDNDGIFPTIQGVTLPDIGRVDEVVAVEEVLTDDLESTAENDSVVTNVNGYHRYDVILKRETKTFEMTGLRFRVPEGMTGTLTYVAFVSVSNDGNAPGAELVVMESSQVKVYDWKTKEEYTTENIPSGEYFYKLFATIRNDGDYAHNINFGTNNMKLLTSSMKDSWKPTFDIWVKNIWQTQKGSGESDMAYADRVWVPILGDKEGNEDYVVFTTGLLSGHEDYDFKIISYAYDTSKEGSEWRLTLQKSDAEMEATGKYIPSVNINAKAGDYFYFTGIDMPHQYVLWAEERLDDSKRDSLLETADINPTHVISFDKVRINSLETGEQEYLASMLEAGALIRIADSRFVTDKAYEQQYLQSITYTWQDGQVSAYPSIEVVLSDKVATVTNPVQQISSEVDVLQQQVGSLSNIQQVIKAVCDALYLRKDGTYDRSLSRTEFASLISGLGFSQGTVGGSGWGIYSDGNGKSVAEFDKIIARDEFFVNSLVSNQVETIGGTTYITSAKMVVMNVETLADGSYKCYLDQKSGTVANLFAVNDLAYSQILNPQMVEEKYYNRLVTEVGDDYIVLSDTEKDGDGIPAIGDVIVQRGNKTEAKRQAFIVIDPLNGGSIRIYSGVDSFSTADKNYVELGVDPSTGKAYFRVYGDAYIGSRDRKKYIEFSEADGAMNVCANMVVGSSGLENFGKFQELIGYLNAIFPNQPAVVAEGAVLAKMLGVMDANNKVVAMLNGSSEGEDAEHGKLLIASGMNGIENAAEAKTRIYEDGYIYTSSIDVAPGGRIGGFTVSEVESFDSLANDDIGNNRYTLWSNNQFVLKDRAITLKSYRSFQIQNYIRENAFISIVSNYEDTTTRGFNNTGLEINVSGVTTTSLGGYTESGNFAIKCIHGQFAGLRPVTRYVSSSQTLSTLDHTILFNSANTCTLTLPSNPENGQTIEIYKNSATTLNISANGKTIMRMGYGDMSSFSAESGFVGLLKFIYSETEGKWWLIAIFRA